MTAIKSSLKLASQGSATNFPSVVVGLVVDYEPEQGVIVDFPGNCAGPLPARLLINTSVDALRAAAESRCPVALVFENGDPSLPLLAGLVQSPTAQVVKINGERIILTGQEEIELRCGDSSISLHKNGRLVIRGSYVETRAKGTNRIKGGSVQIN